MTINERIKLNKQEVRDLMFSYIEYIIEGFKSGFFNVSEIKKLYEYVRRYNMEISDENNILTKILTYGKNVEEDKIDELLSKIDISNESTFNYYDELGDYYASGLTAPKPVRTMPEISDNTRITDEVFGYQLCDQDIMDYFKGSEALFYAMQTKKVIDCGSDLSFYGVMTKEEDGIIRRLRMVVPPIKDLKTALINVNETRHMLDLFDYIGKYYPQNNDFEERARAEEDKFVREYVRNK